MIDQVTIDKIMDAAQIQDVVSDYVLCVNVESTWLVYVRSTTKKLLLSPYLLPKEYSSVSVAEKAEIP